MKQVLRKGFADIVVDEVPDPIVTPHHVLIRPHYSLISSGTETASIHSEGVLNEVAHNPSHIQKVWDVMKSAGPISTYTELRAKFSAYAVLGYSGAGVVVDKHSTVTDLELGDRVAYGGEGTGHGETIITGRNLVARIPDSVSFEHATFATLGSIAMNAVRTANIGIGDLVAVVGLGLVGQLVSQLVRMQGGVVIGLDLKQDRADLAIKLGADQAFANSPKEAVLAATNGRGADCVIVAAAAKSSAPCHLALDICRDRGKIVIVGAVEMDFPWLAMYLKEIQLLMSRAYGPGSYDPAYEKQGHDYPLPYVRWTENRNMEEFLRSISVGRINVQPLITHQYALEEAPQAYETIMNPASGSLAVVLQYPQANEEAGSEASHLRRRVEMPGASAPEQQLNFALVGAGNIARWAHLPVIQKLEGVGLRAVYSASGYRGKDYALRFQAAYCCSDYNEILRDAAVDAVLIVTRNQHHAAQALAALHAGKHVFVEKPMALSVEECSALIQAVRETGKQLSVGFNRRFAPYYRELKKHLIKRSSPAVVSCRINSPGISGSYWMADPAIGGAILGEACHFIDLMYWLLESEPVSVSAYSLPTGKQDPIGENNIVASFQFEDGSIGNLTYCTVGSQTSQGERVEAFAQGVGVFTEDFKKLGVRTHIKSGQGKLWPEKGYDQQLKTFVDALQHGRPVPVNVIDGARSTLGCLQMLESARAGGQPQPIELASLLS
jgi:predicted dehydrogenase/threonine dehydrogenase-like Zn-dependent dehydrogenase